jgi:putative flippase GtrA
VTALYVRFRQLIHEFAKFGIIGVVGLIITNVGYAVLHSHGVGPVTSTTIATIIATIVAYIGNRYWSFRHRERTSVPREGLLFFVLNAIGLLIQDAVVAFNSYVLHLEHHKLAEFLALNLGIAIATVFRFWSYRKFVWRLAPAPAPAEDAGTGAVPGAGAATPGFHGHSPDRAARVRVLPELAGSCGHPGPRAPWVPWHWDLRIALCSFQ